MTNSSRSNSEKSIPILTILVIIIALIIGVSLFKGYLIIVPTIVASLISGRIAWMFSRRSCSRRLEGMVKERTEELEKQKDALKARNVIIEADLDMARRLQGAILPSALPQRKDIRVAVRYIPFDKVRGDYYDVIEFNNGNSIGLFVADVSGHSISAALVTAMAKVTFRISSARSSDPGKVLSEINENIFNSIGDEHFFTAFYGIFYPDNKRLIYASGGHPEAILYESQREEIIPLAPTGPLLGPFMSIECKSRDHTMRSGDKLVIYTDGVFELMNQNGEIWGKKGVSEFIHYHALKYDIDSLLDGIVEQGREFLGGRESLDDITMLGLEIL